ncbi:MAG: methylated-DNA--[protein]-cysteine S-methyltransferase [Lentimicrobium sp.]|nr:methylated-DNA--[protein]-cysteine S-methyltransferase [Lentimicrobium sp.]
MFEPSDKITAYISSPLGFIELISEGGFITGLYFTDAALEEIIPASLINAANQIKNYFGGELTVFDIPVNLKGTNFQLSVWKLLEEIPYGETTTYGEIAAKLGMKNGARAVGLANGSNPVSIIIPCHRVIGQDGKLTGYAGGLWRKEWLLKLEQSELKVGLFSR